MKTITLLIVELFIYFLHVANVDTLRKIATNMLRACLPEIKSQPTILGDLPDFDAAAPALAKAIINSLQAGLLHKYKSIIEATTFYVETFDLHSSFAQGLSKTVFCSALKKWEPQSIVDIAPEYKLTMDVIFSELTECSDVTGKHHILILDLVVLWISSFQEGNVTLNDIRRVTATLEAETWNTFETRTKCFFPETATLLGTAEETNEIDLAVRAMLSVSANDEKIQLARVLHEYSCEPPKALRHILEAYTHDPTTLSMSKTVAAFKKDHELVSELMNEYSETFYLCAYFLQHKSILFREAIFLQSEISHSIGSLANHVQEACDRIQSTIGPSMHYHGVADAIKVLNTTESIYSEIEVLKNSKSFLISATDVTNFEIVAFLWDFSVPVQQFVQCCDKFKFAIAAGDRNFASFRLEVQRFYAADHNPIQACLQFFDQLFCFLCSNSTPTSFDKIKELKTVVPWISLLSDISLQPELWHYVAEMEWFGDVGLKRFYEEYNNVTNVLLGHTQSYEMSLLISVEPVVRIISIVGKLKCSMTTNELFRSFESNMDICAVVRDRTIVHHFHQVHGKLSEIKDWFINGVNEVAASSALFTEAMKHGKFILVKEKSKYYLALTLSGTPNKNDTLLGAALDNFILQLSLIRNESNATSSSMEGLIEQFQVLKAAHRNFVIMDNVGFSSICKSDFICRAGPDNMDEAKILYRVTEEFLCTFKNWLSLTRWQYKLSMLFWTEELRDFNQILSSTVEEKNATVVDFMSRLYPLWTVHSNGEYHHVLRQCIGENIKRFQSNAALSWLEKVSHFIECCHVNFTSNSENQSGTNKSEIVLHSICCANEEEKLCFFLTLTQIYKVSFAYRLCVTVQI